MELRLRAHSLFVFAALCLGGSPMLAAVIPVECGDLTPDVAEAEQLLTNRTDFDAALGLIDRLPILSMSAPCRLYLRHLSAICYLNLGRREAALGQYRAVLDEDPTWRLPRDSSLPVHRLFVEARETTPALAAGPLVAEPSTLHYAIEAGNSSSAKQILTLQVGNEAEIVWRVKQCNPWIVLSRYSGVTTGGIDSVEVSMDSAFEPSPGITRGGFIVIAAESSPDVAVSVRWVTIKPTPEEKDRSVLKWVLIGGAVGAGALLVALVAGGGGDDGGGGGGGGTPPTTDLPDPPDPPGGR